MVSHRLTTDESIASTEFICMQMPFSCFSFVNDRFGGSSTIHRCFSLARANRCRTLVVEKIATQGLLAEDIEDLRNKYSSFVSDDIFRISFWMSPIPDTASFAWAAEADLVGYLIVYLVGKTRESAEWRVFESVFRKYDHPHNCVARPGHYSISVCDRRFVIEGVLYCQQNGITSSCAHVALRSLLSRVGHCQDISYRQMNEIAEAVPFKSNWKPGEGLSVDQIRLVLSKNNISYVDIDYVEAVKDMPDGNVRSSHPFSRVLYAGVESGYGALLGFKMPKCEDDGAGESNVSAGHMIPVYGHTFNKDTWVSDAEGNYFSVDGDVRYLPSENWMSSFIGHDDNFGSNFCIPRFYIQSESVDYVAALTAGNICVASTDAEAAALAIIDDILDNVDTEDLNIMENIWMARLSEELKRNRPRIVLRPVCMKPRQYFNHIESVRDSLNNTESTEVVEALRNDDVWPEYFWVIEFSFPQLFPANERKLGEIVFDATTPPNESEVPSLFSLFRLARLPGCYFTPALGESKRRKKFEPGISCLLSHVPVVKLMD